MFLDAYREHQNALLRLLHHIIVDSQIAHPQFPRSHWIRSHGLAVSCLHIRMMEQLFVHSVQNKALLANREFPKMIFCFR